MALTVPAFTYADQCVVNISILDAGIEMRIPLTPDQISTLTDDGLNSMIADLTRSIRAFLPGVQVQYMTAWYSSANAGGWKNAA